jgi:hypothetical protein
VVLLLGWRGSQLNSGTAHGRPGLGIVTYDAALLPLGTTSKSGVSTFVMLRLSFVRVKVQTEQAREKQIGQALPRRGDPRDKYGILMQMRYVLSATTKSGAHQTGERLAVR